MDPPAEQQETVPSESTVLPPQVVNVEMAPVEAKEATDESAAEPQQAVVPAEPDPTETGAPATKYPKVSLRLNEFGIYELATEEQLPTEEAAKSPDDNAPQGEQPPAAPEVPPAAAAPPTTTPAAPLPEPTNITITQKLVVSSPSSSSNGSGNERERWKQKFPSNAKVQVDIVCCKQCDGYGIANEFVDANYCSEKCRKLGIARQAHLKSGGAKTGTKRKSAPAAAASNTPDVVESSVESTDDTKGPATKCPSSSSAWSWSKYLEKRKAQAAPERLFTDPFPYRKHGFRVGMKLEGIDPEHQSLFCVMTIAEVQGYRLRLHFDGYSDSHDVWVNADSENLFPVGWCEKNGQKLRPPKNYLAAAAAAADPPLATDQSPSTSRTFNWQQYLKSSGSSAAPRHLFISTQNDTLLPSAFRVRMKLEAVDRRHSSHTLCVATVANVIGSRFLVHFDGWDSVYDYWADPTCPYVHPVGWAQEHGTTLTPPCDYEDEEGAADFSWDRYLSKTGSSAVPPRAFKPRSPVGFKTGMKLECVDPRNPQLIRVATVAAVKGYRLKIHFDGWSTDFDFWTDDDWPDLHPPGWCQKTGHPLQPPMSTESTGSSGPCPTPGCNGVGHIEGARYASHTSGEDCPYSSRNLHRDSPAFPDRLQGEDLGTAEIHVQICGSPPSGALEEGTPAKKAKLVKTEAATDSTPSSPLPALTKAAKTAAPPATAPVSIDLPIKSESEAELNNRLIQVELRPESPSLDQQYDSLEALTPPPKKIRLSYFTGRTAPRMDGSERRNNNKESGKENGTDHPESHRNSAQDGEQEGHDVRHQSALQDFQGNANLVTPLCWSKHAALLGHLVSGATSSEATKWSADQVQTFLAKFGLNSPVLDKFKEEEIDGEALLCLTQSDLTDLLGVKLGPAIKIRNALLMIKETTSSTGAGDECVKETTATTSNDVVMATAATAAGSS